MSTITRLCFISHVTAIRKEIRMRSRIITAVLVLFSLNQTNLVAAFVEDFDNPIGSEGRVLFRADPFYDGITINEPPNVSGGDNDGDEINGGFNGLVTKAAFNITRDQGGSGYYLHNQTGGNAPVGNREVWGTITPINVNPNTNYLLCFYLANDNLITSSFPQIEPFINTLSLGTPVSPSGQDTWQQFSFTWNSGSSSTADLSLRNNNGSGSGNDFGIDTIELRIPEPCSSVLVLMGLTTLVLMRRRFRRR
jgi:hypothetical protein